MAPRHHLARHLGMAVAAFELADDIAVPVKAEPCQPLQDRRRRFGRRPLAIGILDAQKELAAAATGIEPVEESGPRAADMQVARGRRGKAGDDGLGVLGHRRVNLSETMTVQADGTH